MEPTTRIYKIDNIKTILITLVVFGHVLEYMGFRDGFLYLLIYSFHMPAFAFISGYCCKRKTWKVLVQRYICTYLVFQTLYIAFAKYILHDDRTFQYTTPYWILWYLLAMFAWSMIISVLGKSRKWAGILLWISVPLALLIGYIPTVRYYLSLSRIIVMLPFFCGGYYLKTKGVVLRDSAGDQDRIRIRTKCLSLLAALVMVFLLYLAKDGLDAAWAYHAKPYLPQQCNIFVRAFFFATAAAGIQFLCVVVPDKKYRVITDIGGNTLWVFLLHGFVIQFLDYQGILPELPAPAVSAVLLTVVMVAGFSSKGPRGSVVTPFRQ